MLLKPTNILFNPSCPMDSKNHLMYGPGRLLSASKQSAVSSTMTGPLIVSLAILHFCLAISCVELPCNSGKSNDLFSKGAFKISFTSFNLLALPVTKARRHRQ